jgi:hypothetical protein
LSFDASFAEAANFSFLWPLMVTRIPSARSCARHEPCHLHGALRTIDGDVEQVEIVAR